MALRQQLHDILKAIPGVQGVYFQPPPNVQMNYPAIVYRRDNDSVKHADNKQYNRRVRYQIMVIDPNPDSAIPSKIAELPLCAFSRFYTADKLNHDVFNLYF